MRAVVDRLPIVLAMGTGLAIAWVDSQPGWDDTAVSVGLILLSAGALSVIWPRQWWGWGVLIGIWIPLWALAVTHNPGAVLALVVALIGAMGGAAIRAIVQGIGARTHG